MGVAFGRSRQQMRGFIPRRKTGFTLVELLVVIGIIAMLAGILLPVLSHMWESSRRTKCASNLRELGRTCAAFADRHGGYYPMCYRMRDTTAAGFPYYVPFCISQGGVSGKADIYSNDANPNYWGVFGTSWIEWQSCGANLQVLTCPSSSGNGAYLTDYTTVSATNPVAHPEWGAVVWIDYMYVGGLSDFPVPTLNSSTPGTARAGTLWGYATDSTLGQVNYTQHSTGHWGTAVPAVQANASITQQGGRTFTSLSNSTMVAVQTDTAVLAADMVFYGGTTSVTPGVVSGTATTWSTTISGLSGTVSEGSPIYRFNHAPLQRKDTRNGGFYWVPDFQNVLYADGSVSPHGQEDYFQPLNTDAVGTTGDGTQMDTGPNWSLLISNSTGAGGYCYWGENEAIPPLLTGPAVPPGPTVAGTWPKAPVFPAQPNLPAPPPAPPSASPQSTVQFNP